jgi:predicted MFS family arabinose efflux permease
VSTETEVASALGATRPLPYIDFAMFRAWRNLGGLPREIWILSLSTLINRMGSMAMPFLVIYLTKKLGYSVAQAGAVLAIYGGAGLVANPVGGWLSDRLGALNVAVISLTLSGATLLFFPLVTGFGGIAAITLVWAILTELFRPASMTLTSTYAPPAMKKQAFALNRLAVNLGFAVGPAVGGIVAQYSYAYLFFIDGGTTLIAAALAWLYLHGGRSAAETGSTSRESVLPAIWGALGDPFLRYFLLASIPVNMVFFQVTSTMPLHLVNNLHFKESTYGLLTSLNCIIITFLEIPLNAATAHWPHGLALGIGSALCALGFGTLALAHNVWEVALTIVIWTFGEMILFPQCSAYVSDISPPERRGGYMGLYMTGFSVAFILGPLAGTYLMETFGATTLWTTVFFWGMISSIFLFRVRNKEASPAFS